MTAQRCEESCGVQEVERMLEHMVLGDLGREGRASGGREEKVDQDLLEVLPRKLINGRLGEMVSGCSDICFKGKPDCNVQNSL